MKKWFKPWSGKDVFKNNYVSTQLHREGDRTNVWSNSEFFLKAKNIYKQSLTYCYKINLL